MTGREFFGSLVRNLAKGLGVRYSFVAECILNRRARSLAAWFGGEAGPEFEYDLRGTPCLKVSEGRTCHHECTPHTTPTRPRESRPRYVTGGREPSRASDRGVHAASTSAIA